ncbi:NADPH:quinone reductase [Marmoricola endophyticus]|uniref:NADPH:quinone reductase n=2 Tax=Marmoricola endophyticus TaxID=2040280 RepID=A0A917BTC7_9ACTN|nr:NADPH:quinone reductase [Marmoricola endophyticus]
MSDMRAVRYDEFGDIDVLRVEEVPDPVPGDGEVVVRLRAAGINPGEAGIRSGALAEVFPSTFPSGQGSDLAGVVEGVGDGVTRWRVGDEVLGYVDTRSSHAELVVVPSGQLVARPATVAWDVAGALHVAGATAYANIRDLDPRPGEVLVVSGAAGGVGSLAVQLAVERGATVVGLASERNHDWLRAHGVVPVAYGEGVEARVRDVAPDGVDAFLDTFGSGYVDLALALGAPSERVGTIIDFERAQQAGVLVLGRNDETTTADLAELTERIADGRLDLEVAATYPLEEVRDAFRQLEKRHTRGKIVLTA